MEQIELFELPPSPKKLTKKEQEEAMLQGMCDRVLARCKEEGADPRQLVLELHYLKTTEFLRRLQPYERRYFIVRLLMEFEQDKPI